MSDNIYLITPKGDFIAMPSRPYESEDVLQRLLAKYPDLLAGEQMPGEEPRRWLLVTREAAVPDSEGGLGRWSLDHLFLDQDAVPTLVEVKRATDTRIRREVVAQMLEYAANGVRYWPVQSLIDAFETTSRRSGKDPRDELLAFLGDGHGDEDPEERFWNQVKTNLAAGKVRMVFVADIIPFELRRLVEFMNEQMSEAEVIAVEVKQYVQGTEDEHRALVPKVIGQTERARVAKSSTGRPRPAAIGEEEFEEELKRNLSSQEPNKVWEFYEWAKRNGRLTPWHGTKTFRPYIDNGDPRYTPFSLGTNGGIQIMFKDNRKNPPFDEAEARLKYLHLVNLIPGIEPLADDAINGEPNLKRLGVRRGSSEPSLWQGVIANDEALSRLQDAVEGFIRLVDDHGAAQSG